MRPNIYKQSCMLPTTYNTRAGARFCSHEGDCGGIERSPRIRRVSVDHRRTIRTFWHGDRPFPSEWYSTVLVSEKIAYNVNRDLAN